MKKIVAMIFARKGSKGLPNKNIKSFCGRPLFVWSIIHAKSIPDIQRVIVSTDSEEIARIAIKHGAEVPFMRPASLAQDDSPEWLSWQHAINYLKMSEGSIPDVMVSIPPTSPLRNPGDIKKAIDTFLKGSVDVVLTYTNSIRNPFFNMLLEGNDGYLKLVNESKVTRRQEAPKTFDISTVAYVVDPNFVMNKNSIHEGRILGIEISRLSSIDIDTIEDFEIAEYFFKRNKKNEDN